MKTYGGMDVQLHVILTSLLDGGVRPASGPDRMDMTSSL